MSVLIAGGCGFIGSHLARKLVEMGEQVLDAKKTFPWPPAYDCAAAQRELGYAPAFTIIEGVQDFVRETKKKYGWK